jgi:hypothetical protein
MRKMQSARTVVTTILLLFSAATGWAQFPNLYFTTPLDLRSGRDFGVLDGTRKVDDTTVILTAPTFKLWKPSPRGQLSLTYEPQFELFAHYGHLSSWNHQAGLRGDYKMTPRWSIDVTDLFVATRDNNLRFDSAFLLPRGPYKENAAFLKLNFDRSSQTRIKLHFDNAFVSFREDHVTRPLFFSRLTNTYGITAEHRFTRKVKLTGDYSYLRSHSLDKYDQFGFLVAPYPPTHVASLTYDYNVTPRLLVELSGGYVRNRINSYVVSGLVEGHFNRVVIGGGFSRYLSYLGSPATPGIQAISGVVSGRSLPPNTINDTASFRAEGDVSNRVGLELALIGTRTTGLKGKNLKGMMARVRVSYKLADHVAVFWSAQFLGQNANELLPEAISRKGVFAGIEYTFSPTAEAVARRRDEYNTKGSTTSILANEKTREGK